MSEAYDNNAIDNNSIDTELQVRLMNLVMGEASDFERDQLQLMMEQRPELAAYCKQLEHLHGLLSEVGTGELSIDTDSQTDDSEWQLPTDRRERVLSVLENRSSSSPPKVTLANQRNFRNWRITATEAIVVASIACVILGLMLPATQSAREAARRLGDTGIAESSYNMVDMNRFTTPANRLVPAKTLTSNVSSSLSEPASHTDSPNVFLSHPTSFADTNGNGTIALAPNTSSSVPNAFYPRPLSPSSSSPMYLSNDVQYPPASPGKKTAYEPPVSGKVDGLAVQKGRQGYATPSFGSPDAGAAVFRPMASTPPSLSYRDFQSKPETTESKFDLEPAKAMLVEELAKTEGRKADGEPLAATAPDKNGAVNLNSPYIPPSAGIPAITADSDLQVRNNFGVTPPIGAPDTAPVGPSLPSSSFSSFLGAQDFVNSLYQNEQALAPFVGSSNSPPVAYPTEDVWRELSARRLERYGDIALKPGQREQLEEVGELDLAQTEVTVPNAGTIMLGGIRLNRLFKQNGSDTSTLMMNVTPKLIIPEEEEEPLGVNLSAASPEIALSNRAESPEPSPDTRESSYPLANRLNPSGSKELKIKEIQPGVPIVIYVPEATEIDQLKSAVTTMRSDMSTNGMDRKTSRSRESAPSPELATNGRDDANAKGKPSTPKQPVALDEQSAAAEAFSTFSLHVSDVSFKLAQAALSQSQWPEAAKIRIEEFVNAMDYHDPLPSGDQKIACRVEQAIHPFLMQRNLLRVSMRTAATGRSQNTPLRLTLLLDNSGSMERPDRRQAVLRAFETLTQQLKATDQITLISFASTPRLLADKVSGNQGATLLQLIETLPSEGGTNIEAALQLAREKAAEQQVAGAQNRIVLLTDGAVNLGDANPESLAKQVTQMRDAGIAFDAAGISAQDLNDEVLEALTRHGDGRYYLLDSAETAGESFAAQIAGSLRPSAQNVKVQVEFNPQRVGRYKLLGYEKHRLNKEDFRNDQVDAAEMAAAEAGVAVYQFEIKPKGTGDVGSVSVRFRDLANGQMVERRWPILYESNTPRLEQAQASMQLAAAAALFAAKLGGGPLADSVDLGQLQNLIAKLPEQFANQPRVQQLRAMIEQAIAIQ